MTIISIVDISIDGFDIPEDTSAYHGEIDKFTDVELSLEIGGLDTRLY